MRGNRGAIKYALGMAGSQIGLTNMYIHGGSILSLVTFGFGLLSVGSIEGAVHLWIDFYVTKLLPWPIDELLAAQTITELMISHIITISVGLASATSKWWLRI